MVVAYAQTFTWVFFCYPQQNAAFWKLLLNEYIEYCHVVHRVLVVKLLLCCMGLAYWFSCIRKFMWCKLLCLFLKDYLISYSLCSLAFMEWQSLSNSCFSYLWQLLVMVLAQLKMIINYSNSYIIKFRKAVYF